MQQNNQQDIWTKIFLLEKDLLENQKYLNKVESSYIEVVRKIDSIKEDIISQKDLDSLESRITELEEMVDSLRQEMPEMRLIRKMFFALVGFVLTAFLGLVWNSLVLNSSKNTSMLRPETQNEIAKKIIEEYSKDKR